MVCPHLIETIHVLLFRVYFVNQCHSWYCPFKIVHFVVFLLGDWVATGWTRDRIIQVWVLVGCAQPPLPSKKSGKKRRSFPDWLGLKYQLSLQWLGIFTWQFLKSIFITSVFFASYSHRLCNKEHSWRITVIAASVVPQGVTFNVMQM